MGIVVVVVVTTTMTKNQQEEVDIQHVFSFAASIARTHVCRVHLYKNTKPRVLIQQGITSCREEKSAASVP